MRRGWILAWSVCLMALGLPATAHAGFDAPVTVTASGADPFGYPSDVGFDSTGGVAVETVSGGSVFVYTKPAGASAFTGNTLGSGTKASLAVSANGAAVTAWKASATSVRVAYRSTATGGFDTSAATFNGSAVGNVAAGIDAHGNAVVAWKDGAIHYALSTGGSFGAVQDGPLGSQPGFEGRGSDPQRDHGPRAFRDDAGNVVLVYRDGPVPTLARRSPEGAWTSTALPDGAGSTDISADADPTSHRLIIGYSTAGTFQAFEGATTTTAGVVKVSQPVSNQPIFSVAVRRGGTEDLALWRDSTNAVRSASCLEGFTPATVASAGGGGLVAAVTSGSDELAFFPGGGGFDRASRSPGGTWTETPYAVGNFGTMAGGAGYKGDALALFVDYPSDTGITGFPYGGPATATATCGSADPDPAATITPTGTPVPTPTPDGRHPTATQLSCAYHPALGSNTCLALVRDTSATAPQPPTGSVTFTASDGPQGNGTFTVGSRCTLAATGQAGTAGCSVEYFPPTVGLPRLQADYAGDATHLPSTTGTAPAAAPACLKAKTPKCADPMAPAALCKATGPVYTQCTKPTVLPVNCTTAVIGSSCQSTGTYTTACGSIGTGLGACPKDNTAVTVCGGGGAVACPPADKVVLAEENSDGSADVDVTVGCPADKAKPKARVATPKSFTITCAGTLTLDGWFASQIAPLRAQITEVARILKGIPVNLGAYYDPQGDQRVYANYGTHNANVWYRRAEKVQGENFTPNTIRTQTPQRGDDNPWTRYLPAERSPEGNFIGEDEYWNSDFVTHPMSLFTDSLQAARVEGHRLYVGHKFTGGRRRSASVAGHQRRPLLARKLRLGHARRRTLHLHLTRRKVRSLKRAAGRRAKVVPIRLAIAYRAKPRPVVLFTDFALRLRR